MLFGIQAAVQTEGTDREQSANVSHSPILSWSVFGKYDVIALKQSLDSSS